MLAFKDQMITNGKGEIVTKTPQSKVAVSMSEIKWDNYDIVISINFSIDEDIVKKHSRVLWCYMLQEPSMRHYKKSMHELLFSYDLFLNQKFTYQLSRRKKHEINFPYNFMNSRSFLEMTGNKEIKRQGIFIEIHSVNNITGNLWIV